MAENIMARRLLPVAINAHVLPKYLKIDKNDDKKTIKRKRTPTPWVLDRPKFEPLQWRHRLFTNCY